MVAKTPRNTGRTPAERRAYWLDRLTPEEREDVEYLERAMAAQVLLLRAEVAEMKAKLKQLGRRRQRIINKGTGRALYAINGRAEWRAKSEARSKT